MKKKFLKNATALILAAMAGLSLAGCGDSEEKEYATQGEIESGFEKYDEILEDGKFYIRHQDGKYESLFLGETTFSKGTVSMDIQNTKLAWFKEDFENIPTLFKDDSLIMYTHDVFEETFRFERFYDYGYSIGLRNMEVTPSGRFRVITTTKEGGNAIVSYPNGDTTKIEDFENETVIIDKLGGIPLRDYKVINNNNKENDEDNKDNDENNNENTSFLTNAGTIGGLQKDARYKAEIYEGTVKHEFTFTANVRILGQFEYFSHHNYEFESKTIINIEIPDDWESGYYMIEGIGMFRYVNGDSYDENTDFNIPNKDFIKEDEESESNDNISDNTGDYDIADDYDDEILKIEDYSEESAKLALDEILKYNDTATETEKKFITKKLSVIKVGLNICTVELNNGKDVDGIIIRKGNDELAYKFSKKKGEDGIYECVFFVDDKMLGDYTITFPEDVVNDDIRYITLNIAR